MKEKAGRIIHYVQENQPIKGCTISKQIVFEEEIGIFIFSLAKNTSISKETYTYPKLWMVLEGKVESNQVLKKEECMITPIDEPIGLQAIEDSVYIEVEIKKESKMNEVLKSSEVFTLESLVPYQEGKIVNMDLVHNEKMKLVVMSFDEGCGLSEHAAPAEALIFALDGQGVIGYEGEEFILNKGESFKFDKLGKHYVRADQRFKMALLLVFE